MERRRRITILVAVLLLSAGVLAGSAISAEEATPREHVTAEGPYPGPTLITVQAYGGFGGHNGEAFIVNADGERLWEYQPDDAAVFDAEYLENGTVMLSYGQKVPDEECPSEWRDTPEDHCIENHVREIDPETDEVVWEYTWHDRYMNYHEVHDADRLDNGETVIIDMGQHRVFTVDEDGERTWEWSAIEHLDEGTPFWEEHVEGTAREDHHYTGPNQDWTHMNDVDRLENGNFLLSIRNFDVLIEVDPETDEVVRVIGEPGDHDVMYEQHDPNYLEEHDHVIVSDSENNRIVEYDVAPAEEAASGEDDSPSVEGGDATFVEEVWRYEGPGPNDRLAWPRDADRLPNGNTLIADSRNFRVLEVNETGSVVWSYDMREQRGIVYDADRLDTRSELGERSPALDEEPENVPPGDQLDGTEHSTLSDYYNTARSWLGFVLPPWVGAPGLVAILFGVGSIVGLVYEGYRGRTP
ncbi:MAG: arylsulfotransferase family protein [Haloferacaceae archaeon]